MGGWGGEGCSRLSKVAANRVDSGRGRQAGELEDSCCRLPASGTVVPHLPRFLQAVGVGRALSGVRQKEGKPLKKGNRSDRTEPL